MNNPDSSDQAAFFQIHNCPLLVSLCGRAASDFLYWLTGLRADVVSCGRSPTASWSDVLFILRGSSDHHCCQEWVTAAFLSCSSNQPLTSFINNVVFSSAQLLLTGSCLFVYCMILCKNSRDCSVGILKPNLRPTIMPRSMTLRSYFVPLSDVRCEHLTEAHVYVLM